MSIVVPGFSKEVLEMFGYKEVYWFALGYLGSQFTNADASRIMNWAGNSSGNSVQGSLMKFLY